MRIGRWENDKGWRITLTPKEAHELKGALELALLSGGLERIGIKRGNIEIELIPDTKGEKEAQK
ncbi:MAG: hypothetical protein Q8K68_13170 [Nitrospirota bacterium]|nr:hypothetical protein [Nitrospirota bacterium]